MSASGKRARTVVEPTVDDGGDGSTAVDLYNGGGGGGGGGAGAGLAPAGAAVRLSDQGFTPLEVRDIENPVFVIHAPRGSGCTSLLGALLAALPGLHAAVVLTDRASSPGYMHGVVPKQMVLNKPPKEVLKAMLGVQDHARRNFPEEPLPKLALALDDVVSAKILKDDEFKADLKIARDFNIAVIMATANAGLLPADVHTFATHVAATRCVAAKEPKQLYDRLFVMFESADALRDALALCQPFEFLVGALRLPATGSLSLTRMVHTFAVPPVLPLFAMAAPLVEKLSFALSKSRRGEKDTE
jgi:hypothetical protein